MDAHKIVGAADKLSQKILSISDAKMSEADGKVFIEGYANTKNRKDRYGDIPTVFTKVRPFVYDIEQYRKNPVLMIDHHNNIDHVAGSVVEIKEDENGLWFKAAFSNSDLPLIKHAREVYREGHAKGISIGGVWHFEDPENPDHLTLAEIFEISLVGIGADSNALATAMEKAMKLLADEQADKQTQASMLHQAKSEIDRWLEDLRKEKILQALNDIKDKFH
jgi:HK97 family phage prohead protease